MKQQGAPAVDCDFAQLVKQYDGEPGKDAARRYSPGWIIGTTKTTVQGDPDEGLISTSYVERSNLTVRQLTKRFARLTNAFSKKIENHRSAVSLFIGYYNYCWVQITGVGG